MAYQPTFASPYLTSIDVNTVGGNNFKCLINPRDTIEKYRINIYSVLDNSLVCYIRGEVVDGIQKKWYKTGDSSEVSVDITNLIEESALPLQGSFSDDAWLVVNVPKDVGLLNGMDYKWNIELWGRTADVQVANNTVYNYSKDSNTNEYKLIVNSKMPQIENGMFVKYKNEMREVLSSYINESDTCSVFIINNAFTNSATKDEWVTFYTNKIISFDYYFEARSTPMTVVDGENISLENGFYDIVPDTIFSNRIELSVPYLQAENVGIDFYKFELYLGDELIHTTKEVYSSNIEYEYSGLISGNEYKIKLVVCLGNNETITLSDFFVVECDKYNAIINPVIKDIADKGCVEIDFSQNSSIDGVLEGIGGDVVYAEYKNGTSAVGTNKNNAINLNTYQSIYWDNFNDNPLDLENTTQIIHWHGHPGFNGIIFEKIDETNLNRNIVVGYNGDAFYYQFGTNMVIYDSPFSNYPNYESAINATLNEDLLYKLSNADNLKDTDNLASNDIANTYWWFIVIRNDRVDFIQSKKYAETEV